MSPVRTAGLAAAVATLALAAGAASAQVAEQVSPGQPGGIVLLGGLRHALDDAGTLQLDAGGGHTTNVNSDIAFARLTLKPAKHLSVFVNYVYVVTAADPSPASRLHIPRAGGEVTKDLGLFQLANQAELELLGIVGQSKVGRGRDQLRFYSRFRSLRTA